jgi:hypothetical protein
MFERSGGMFHLQWKNSPVNEDEDGQRILYTFSADGKVLGGFRLNIPRI